MAEKDACVAAVVLAASETLFGQGEKKLAGRGGNDRYGGIVAVFGEADD